MKRKIILLIFVALFSMSCQNDIWDAIDELKQQYSELDGRVSQLEELCKEMNTNISSLQTLVSVILNNDYIISTTPITKDGTEIGYTITFAIHDPITIYHGKNGADGQDGKNGENGKDGADGKNGKDGENGKDGQDGSTPIISVAIDSSDGAYYWTLNGSWLLTPEGERVPVTSRDGKAGRDGKDGENGKDGQDGNDGITPRLKIENDYWYISYDSGVTWTQLYKAVGEDGQDGDNIFQSVTYDINFVIFKLNNGTEIKIPISSSSDEETIEIIDGAIISEFSVSDTKKVYFSQGNLQYNAMLGTHKCADGTSKQGTWRFAEHQWDIVRESNENISETYDGWIDLFGFGTSGWHDASDIYNVNYNPWSTSNIFVDDDNYYGYGPSFSKGYLPSYYDWGVYNSILNGGNKPNIWRTLSCEEWDYLINKRNNDISFASAWFRVHTTPSKTEEFRALLLFPDGFSIPSNLAIYNGVYELHLSEDDLMKLVNQGVVLLVDAGQRVNKGYSHGSSVVCWIDIYSTLASSQSSDPYQYLVSTANYLSIGVYAFNYGNVLARYYGFPIRLVRDVK